VTPRVVGFAGRGLVLAVALLLALVASGTAATAKKKSAAKKPAAVPESLQVLATVGKEPIRRVDVQRRIDVLPEQYRANYSTPEGRQQLLDRLIEERVWLQRAKQDGVPERPIVKQQIEQQSRDLVVRTYLNELMAEAPPVSDEQARSYYDEHLSEYKLPASITLRHIQLKKESDAKNVKNQAKTKDWTALAKKWSTDTLTKNTGGSLGTVTLEGHFAVLGTQPALAESAFTLGKGAVGGPWKTDRGWHVIQVDDKREESVREFDQVKQVITRQLGSKNSQDYYRLQLETARREVGVKPDSAAIRAWLSQKKTAREMFNEAQAAGPPEARIEAYRKLLVTYPTADVSPQAQFMIGFIYSEEIKDYDKAEAEFRMLIQRWPKAELAPSAQWMIEHMRTEEAPPFLDLSPDSTGAHNAASGAAAKGAKKP